jgi:hypothetical protein
LLAGRYKARGVVEGSVEVAKEKQKTFGFWRRRQSLKESPVAKVFWFFFSKKNILTHFASPAHFTDGKQSRRSTTNLNRK